MPRGTDESTPVVRRGPLVVSLVVTTGGGYAEGLLLARTVLAVSAGVPGWRHLPLREDAPCR